MLMPRGAATWVGVGAYSQAAVVPADKSKPFKEGLDISEKKFQDMATAAGGYMRLSFNRALKRPTDPGDELSSDVGGA